MQSSIISTTHKTKATDLKKIMQQACKNNHTHTNSQLLTKSIKQPFLKNYTKDLTHSEGLKAKQSDRSNKPSNLVNQLKELNLKRGLNSLRSSQNNSLKGKQNITNPNDNRSDKIGKLTTSTLIKEQKKLIKEKSSKNLKATSSTDSLQSVKTISSITTNFDKKIKKQPDQLIIAKKQSTKVKNQKQQVRINKRVLSMEDFKLGKKLGRGRFGNVYLAEYIPVKFILAIKIVNKKQLSQSNMQNQLIQQIKIQTYMNHPNLLKMYGFFSDSTNIYLLLQLGTSLLFKQLRINKKYSQEQAAYYIKQIIQSLKFLHSESIIHRDLKPQNILLNEGVAKVSDFGWSIYSPSHKRQTFCGTLEYVSPQIVQGQFYDQKVDIWSLGVLCYQLVVGKAPFQGENDQKRTYDKILSVQITFPESMSNQLKDLISRILIKEPKQRLDLLEIQRHNWLVKHSKVGRYISKQVWQRWQSFK